MFIYHIANTVKRTQFDLKMVKYKRTIVGKPYVKYDPQLTEGFTPGVGYLKNLLANKPVWFTVGVCYLVSGVYCSYRLWEDRGKHSDYRLAQKECYSVKRPQDVDDPTRDCYN